MNPEVMKYQRRLRQLGFDPGPIDGIRGPRTIQAIRQFQRSRRLRQDGLVGPRTAAALYAGSRAEQVAMQRSSASLAPDARPWMEEARRLMGVREQAGGGSSGIILSWARRLNSWYNDDDIPWCGLFVAHCINYTMPDEPIPTDFLRARSWEDFGREAPLEDGVVVVFWRKSRSSGLGHVGFCVGADDNFVYTLGGNQGNEVNVRKIERVRLVATRLPSTALSQGRLSGLSGGVKSDGNEA